MIPPMMTLFRSIAPDVVLTTALLVGFAAACAAQVPAPDDVAAAPPDAVTTASGLAHKVVQAGTGSQHPSATSNVTVHYTGWLMDGAKFDSSLDRGEPFEFVIGGGQVIRGWDQGVESMKVGGKRELIIPPSLAYGNRGVGNIIPPGATLKFEVELIGNR